MHEREGGNEGKRRAVWQRGTAHARQPPSVAVRMPGGCRCRQNSSGHKKMPVKENEAAILLSQATCCTFDPTHTCARRLALELSSPMRGSCFLKPSRAAAATTPDCRMPPPSALRTRIARPINSADPAIADPTGALRPRTRTSMRRQGGGVVTNTTPLPLVAHGVRLRDTHPAPLAD